MNDGSPRGGLSASEIVEWSTRYTLFDWAVQSKISPIPVASAKGVYFYDPDGKRYLDFNSQLMSVNIGHGDPRVVEAVARQIETLSYVNSAVMTTEVRALLGHKLAQLFPGDIEKSFFTLGGAEANENAIRIAKAVTGRHKILARYRSYHGATAGAITLTGDPRRWANEPGIPGVVHVLDFYHGTTRPMDSAAEALRALEETIELEGPKTIAAFIIEPVTGTNGILVPPDGYLEGVRELCDRYGILMIADEVMAGFGRCGEWFAVDHWGVRPDLITFAKGVNSGYVPLGGVVLSAEVAATFEDRAYPGGLTYSGHPLACASAVASITIMREEGIVEHARDLGTDVIGPALAKLAENHPSVGEVRGLGVFWALELVRDRETREPLVPFNAGGAAAAPMTEFMAACKERGLWPFVHFNRTHVVPPCTTTAEEVAEGIGILDEALTVADRYYTGS